MQRLKKFPDESIVDLASKHGSLVLQTLNYENQIMQLEDFFNLYSKLDEELSNSISTLGSFNSHRDVGLDLKLMRRQKEASLYHMNTTSALLHEVSEEHK